MSVSGGLNITTTVSMNANILMLLGRKWHMFGVMMKNNELLKPVLAPEVLRFQKNCYEHY